MSNLKQGPFAGGCRNSAARVDFFVHEFIRSDYVANWTAEKDSDFINYPDRAARCADAAEFGADGKTHAEVINDWRDAFKYWLRDSHSHYWQTSERFAAAVNAHFDSVEAWHEAHGSLFELGKDKRP